jgi:hypothetical protein
MNPNSFLIYFDLVFQRAIARIPITATVSTDKEKRHPKCLRLTSLSANRRQQ